MLSPAKHSFLSGTSKLCRQLAAHYVPTGTSGGDADGHGPFAWQLEGLAATPRPMNLTL